MGLGSISQAGSSPSLLLGANPRQTAIYRIGGSVGIREHSVRGGRSRTEAHTIHHRRRGRFQQPQQKSRGDVTKTES